MCTILYYGAKIQIFDIYFVLYYNEKLRNAAGTETALATETQKRETRNSVARNAAGIQTGEAKKENPPFPMSSFVRIADLCKAVITAM